MKRLIYSLLALILIFGIVNAADTGTYKILNYSISLTPRSDGHRKYRILSEMAGNRRAHSLDYGRHGQREF